MTLHFERGTQSLPVGHALIYFRADDGAILATYISVPPIQFDLSQYMPGFLTTALQGMDLGDAMVATPMPPIPEEIPGGLPYLLALAERRADDLVYAGAASRANPMQLAAETAEAARQYGEMYSSSAPSPEASPQGSTASDVDHLDAMSQEEQLGELTHLTGRLRDSIAAGLPDLDVERQMRHLAEILPAKYRVADLIAAAHVPGERGQHLASLHLERCYKLFHEEYLDLERIDREIAAIQDS